ncbi:hypothetical protein BST97_12110 [Nonlabens spongiae]|uniref:Uncharacterized protein n=1 Tax=Nonlabens spongiae TaxID=331648 RepID=A0A1W6MM45_9FLAO|nr:hypothetical protein [Nonlabens spongiae]ARN78674.1 hypothetical protein BST97_12110 [Nonlabens spongiae]
MTEDIKYINFPLVMLRGFMSDTRSVLKDVLYYAIAKKIDEYYDQEGFEWTINEDECKGFAIAMSYYGLKAKYNSERLNRGRELMQYHEDESLFVGINIDHLISYMNTEKSDFQKVCLLGFLAFKSIIQDKPYCKVTNKYWLSRMDGKAKSIRTEGKYNFQGISDDLQPYCNKYQLGKIKNELRDNWNVLVYSYYTRGFYVAIKSDKMNLDKLVYCAEVNRKTTKEKQAQREVKDARERALLKIQNASINQGK